MSLMLYIAALVALSLVALFTVINLAGIRSMTRIENIIVGAKLSVLIVFAVVGMTFIMPDQPRGSCSGQSVSP